MAKDLWVTGRVWLRHLLQLYVTYNPLLITRIRHRGPRLVLGVKSDHIILCHRRLAIVGVDSGAQPLTSRWKVCGVEADGRFIIGDEVFEGVGALRWGGGGGTAYASL
jgi:hypothetical protein